MGRGGAGNGRMDGVGRPSSLSRWVKVMCVLCIVVVFVARTLITTQTSTMVEDFLINEEVLAPRARWDDVQRQRSAAVRQGLAAMRASNVTFVGIARDVGRRLPSVLAQVQNLAQEFRYSRAIFVEGQSNDNTPALLAAWVHASPHNRTAILKYFYDHHEQEGFFKGRKMPREGRLAAARNQALRAMRAMPQQTEYVIVVDPDIIGFDPHGVADTFAPRGHLTWDAVCANGMMLHGTYRDTFAFRTEALNNTNVHWWDHEPFDLYNLTASDKAALKREYDAHLHAVRSMMDFSGASSRGFVRVKSCFGGLAIYRTAAMDGCEYEYREPRPPHMLDCEHVLLHQCMIDKHQANIFTNADMRLWYGHGYGGGGLSWAKIRQVFNF